jgi:histidine triad (HIT) family protein
VRRDTVRETAPETVRETVRETAPDTARGASSGASSGVRAADPSRCTAAHRNGARSRTAIGRHPAGGAGPVEARRYGAVRMASCLFCRIVAGDEPAAVVGEDAHVVAFLDVRPVFPGHCLVVPRAHHETLADLPAELLAPLFGFVRRLSIAVPAALGAQGTFVAVNNVVSQSVPHVHVHVVPRTKGDGLRGFFWPRTKYVDAEEMAATAARIGTALQTVPG